MIKMLFRDSLPAVDIFIFNRDTISRWCVRPRKRRLFPKAFSAFMNGTMSLLLFHSFFVFYGFKLMDFLQMLLSIRLVSSRSIDTQFLMIIMKFLLYRSLKLNFIVEVILNRSISRSLIRFHRISLEINLVVILFIIFVKIRNDWPWFIVSFWWTFLKVRIYRLRNNLSLLG